MKFFKLRRNEGYRYLAAILGGVLLAASFPKPNLAGLAWVAPGLILGAAMGTSGWSAFRIGYVAGLAHFLASLYWLLLIPVPIAPIVGWLALSAYLSLYPALWVWLCWTIYPRGLATSETEAAKEEPPDQDGSRAAFAAKFARILDQFNATPWLQRLGWSLACAALWVSWEMIQARLFSGFPWNFLGASQYQALPLLQISAYTGVYGVSFLAAWFAVALLGAIASLRRRGSALIWGREIIVPLLVVIGVLGFGLHRILSAPEPQARLKVLMVQPSIPQTVIWDPKESAARFEQLIELTEKGLAHRPDLLLWPEAALPSLFRWDTNRIYKGQTVSETVTNLAKQHQVWLITGGDDAVPRADAPDGADFYNSSYLISPEGEVRNTYRKQNLVIFGEYVPLSRWFPFLMKFIHVYGEFTRGPGPVTFHLPDLRVKTSVLICFEDVFPHLAHRHVEPDTDFLVNLTNDGWFGESAAHWQQAANAVFRAIENGLPLVRATNNGLTCWVDPYGELHEVYYPGFKNIYQAGYKIARVPILAGQARQPTFYNRHGDWFGWGCVGLAGLLIIRRALRRGSSAQNDE